LAGVGQYREALAVFARAREVGKKFENWTFQARAIAMSAGFHLDVFDFEGHEAAANEARECALSMGFQPSVVSASIDLIFNHARRGDPCAAEKLADRTTELAARIGGWHGWLWDLRLGQARAEVALAKGDWREALRRADAAVAVARRHSRLK